ncbi:uncharacterized protein LOC111832374 [Capsella rubella]|uniref:uncharacterized protein LOC111832374 n=1 Tax=Capsella rubella TaxID=81985 RepID=UPI000CD5B2B1|nr:uncharacterized protein LOC111832374 [Capsella rubella]
MEYQRWLTKLLGFDFDIHYKPGLENKAADALSRKEVVPSLFALSVPAAIQLEEICVAVDRDPELQKVIKELSADKATHPDYSMVQGRLLRQGKLVIPKGSLITGLIMREFHDGKLGGHGGVLKTQKRIAELFYWTGMLQDIKQYVAACQPLPVPQRIWEDISMDFVEGLPKSGGYNAVLVVVDRLSKYSHFLKLKHPFTATEVANLFIQEIVKLQGFPRTIVSDRDKAVYGREPPTLVKYEDGSTSNVGLEQQLKERDAALALIKSHLHKAQHRMKKKADEHRREVEFAVGDMVFLKMRPYRRKSLARRVNEKLSARFYGPYQVEARVGKLAYRLKLPTEAKIHPTFHVSQLKKAVGNQQVVVSVPAQLTEEGILNVEPEAVLGFRQHPVSGQQEVLIQWKDLPDYENSWEWGSTIQGQFPTFDLEDKVNYKGGGNDTLLGQRPPILHQDKRRNKARTQVQAHQA